MIKVLIGMFIVIVIFSIVIVNGIDDMHKNHPDYNGEDLYGEDEA